MELSLSSLVVLGVASAGLPLLRLRRGLASHMYGEKKFSPRLLMAFWQFKLLVTLIMTSLTLAQRIAGLTDKIVVLCTMSTRIARPQKMSSEAPISRGRVLLVLYLS